MIGIVDYGMGNIKAFANIYKNLNLPHRIVQNSSELEGITRIILPGVGAFDHAMTQLQNSGMREILDKLVLKEKLPVLGICVGMQMLAKKSDEGSCSGLSWIDAVVKKFDKKKLDKGHPLPHMGWNTVKQFPDNPLFQNIEPNSKFYFLHSYYFNPQNSSDSIAIADYGDKFTCVVNNGNIFGVQFHPEKSHHNGIQLLKNFGEL